MKKLSKKVRDQSEKFSQLISEIGILNAKVSTAAKSAEDLREENLQLRALVANGCKM